MPDLPDVAARRPRPVLLGVRILLWRCRRVVAVAGLALLALGVARTAAPPPPATAPVVVTAADVAAGSVLGDEHLRVVRVPRALVPAGAAGDAAALVGAEVAVPLPAGLPVVPELLAGERFTVSPPPGTVVVPVHLADPAVAALLRPGDRVDVVAGGDGAAAVPDVVARDALVLETRTTEHDAGALGLGTDTAVLTVVAVAPDDGRRLAALAGWDSLGAVLVG